MWIYLIKNYDLKKLFLHGGIGKLLELFLRHYFLVFTSAKMNLEISIIRVKIMKGGLSTQAGSKQQELPQIGICGCTILLIKFLMRLIKKNMDGKRHTKKIRQAQMKKYNPIKIKKDTVKKKYETWK